MLCMGSIAQFMDLLLVNSKVYLHIQSQNCHKKMKYLPSNMCATCTQDPEFSVNLWEVSKNHFFLSHVSPTKQVLGRPSA